MRHNLVVILLVVFVGCGTGLAQDLTPEERGLQIAQEASKRDSGHKDSVSELSMILRLGSGQEATRELRIRTLEISETEGRAMVIFDTPADVRGTALLTHVLHR